jgi:hypothetical protein
MMPIHPRVFFFFKLLWIGDINILSTYVLSKK